MIDPHELVRTMVAQAGRWEAAHDRRAIFLRTYSMMTDNMLQALEQQRFADGEWVGRLLHRFADYYFDALACFDCGENVPLVWQEVHRAAAERDLHILQHLLLGVNAHINYDLVLTLDEMLRPEWAGLSESKRTERYQDHRLVNTIIGETIDAVQDEVVEPHSPVLRLVDQLFGRLDERLLIGLIRRWREEVWTHAQAMLPLTTPTQREQFRQTLEAEVMQKSRWLATDLF